VQTERDADNLRRSLVQELGAVHSRVDLVDAGSRRVRIKSIPIGIDVNGFQQAAQRSGSSRLLKQTIAGLGSRKLIIRVDRLDYSRGIPERMEAFERFLVIHPDQRGRVTYLQIAPTSRSEVPEYVTHSRVVNGTLGRINGPLGEPGWVPIHYVTSTYSRAVLAGLYRLSRVGHAIPIRDGMNLVAKEYVAAQDPQDPGVLILPKFAGPAEELADALVVNPSDKVEVSDALQHALHMSQEERVDRWQAMLKVLWASDVSRWAAVFIRDLASHKTSRAHGRMVLITKDSADW
jgi:trehalose 6-phosphate synthase